MTDPEWKDALHTDIRIRLSFWDWCKALLGTIYVHSKFSTAALMPAGRATETTVDVGWRPTWWPFKPKPMTYVAPSDGTTSHGESGHSRGTK